MHRTYTRYAYIWRIVYAKNTCLTSFIFRVLAHKLSKGKKEKIPRTNFSYMRKLSNSQKGAFSHSCTHTFACSCIRSFACLLYSHTKIKNIIQNKQATATRKQKKNRHNLNIYICDDKMRRRRCRKEEKTKKIWQTWKAEKLSNRAHHRMNRKSNETKT